MDYNEFLHTKQRIPPACGFDKPRDQMNHLMFEWQKDITRWALRKGRAALFEDCGNGKTIQQLEFAHSVSERTGMPVLIVAPLTVGEQTRREAVKFGYSDAKKWDEWELQDELSGSSWYLGDHLKWANFDILDCSDNTVYLAASEPVPLYE